VRYRGREIDPISLWAEYCEVKEGEGPFLPLTYCPNPEHDNSRSPAFQINIDKPLVHCFAGCGISGTYEHAIGVITGDDKRAVRKRILRHSRIQGSKRIPSKRRRSGGRSDRVRDDGQLVERLDDISRFSYLPPFAVEYLDNRGISSGSISRWELGWDQDSQRIVIPVRDARGVIRMHINRAVKPHDFPKYLYTEGVDKTSLLFGAWQIDPGLVESQGLIVVEGSIDCIRLHQHGFKNTVAILGTYVSEIQSEIIAAFRPKRITLMFDKDIAGIAGITRAKQMLKKTPLYVARYPAGISDPAELDRKGARRVIERSVSIMKFNRLTTTP